LRKEPLSPEFALSLKQPWAALVVQGLKTIEVRRWPTARRGRILIHAARVPDNRGEAWKHVTPALLDLAQLQGGIIGSVDLTDCLRYADLPNFLADQTAHYNEPSWYEPPLMFGFKFADAKVLPFQRYPGWFRFFSIKPELMESRSADPKST
jgi:ASCH domain